MDETPIGEMNYLITFICRYLNGAITYAELQRMPLPELYEISNNLGKLLQEENKSG